jgi:hypothetical protein
LRTKALIILFCLLAVSTSGYAATFSANITNITKDAVVGDYPISVRLVDANKRRQKEAIREIKGRTDSDGLFVGEIEAPAGKVLMAEVNYRGLEYLSKLIFIKNNQQHYDLAVKVYEITSSHEEVSIPSRTMVLTPIDERTLEVYESLQVNNSGNHTYVGAFNDELDVTQVLHIPVPESYTLRGFEADGIPPKIRTLGRAIVSQNEIKPGTSQISMRYLVVSDIGFFDLSLFNQKDTPLVEELNLYFPVTSKWHVKPATLKLAGEELLRNKNHWIWKGQPGSVLRLKAYGPTYTGGFNFWHITIFLAFLITGVCLLLTRKKISRWYLIQEEKKLGRLQDIISKESDDQELAEYYQPLRQVLDRRFQEARHIIKGG